MKAVLDSNIYRGFNTANLEALLQSAGLTPFLSPLNVLEILGLKDDPDTSFGARRAAAQKMLRVCSEADGSLRWVEDPEIFHARLLGSDTSHYEFDLWREALERLTKAQVQADLDDAQTVVNYAHARTVRETAYKQFQDKVQEISSAYHDWYKNDPNASQYFARNDRDLIFAAIEGTNSFCLVRKAEFKRIWDVVRQTNSLPEPACNSVLGAPKPSLVNRLNPYTELYIEYVVEHIATGKIDKNDFGDLQFAVYCGDGFTLISNETQWPELAARTSISGKIASSMSARQASRRIEQVDERSGPGADLLRGLAIGSILGLIAGRLIPKSTG